MTTDAETRRHRLRAYIDDECNGNAAELARRVGRSDSQINDMLSGIKSFGEKVARDMETKLGLPKYWLDLNPDAALLMAYEIRDLSDEARNHIAWIIERDKALRRFK